MDIFGIDLGNEFSFQTGDKNIGHGRNHLELMRLLSSFGYGTGNFEIGDRALELAPKDDIKIIETISDEKMLSLVNEYKGVYTQLANVCGKDSLFINEFPKCYGKERPAYDKVTFNKEQMDILHEAINSYKNEYSSISFKRIRNIFLKKVLVKLGLFATLSKIRKFFNKK